MTEHAPRGEVEFRYADDLVVGQEHDLGSYELTRESIIDFARQWDPLYFHTDPAAAGDSAFGTLVASGIQTVAVFQRLCVLAEYATWHMVAGKAVRDLRFLAPVRPGDVLSGRMVIRSVSPVPAAPTGTSPQASGEAPGEAGGRAVVTLDGTLRNQTGAVVLRLTVDCVVAARG